MKINKTILFVCLGNICRSPTAEGVFKHLIGKNESLSRLKVESCGTIGFHSGEPPDSRSILAAAKRGYDLNFIRSKKINTSDFEYYDYNLAMDEENLAKLVDLASSVEGHKRKANQKIQLFLDYAESTNKTNVPDPYYGAGNGFDQVIDLVEEASEGFIAHLIKEEVGPLSE